MGPIAELLAKHSIKLESAAPGRYYTKCPQCSHKRSKAHQDNKVLGVTVENNGNVFWGCNHCGWTGPEKGSGGNNSKFAATYDYVDDEGALLFQKVRNPPGSKNRFWCRRPDGNGGWIHNTKGINHKPLYRWPEVAEAIEKGHTIAIVEGEKDVDNLWRIGVPATCNFDGAADITKGPNVIPKWKPAYSEALCGTSLIVFGDNDAQGYAHAQAVCCMSSGLAARVQRLDLAKHWPNMPKGADVSDWLAAGHTREELDNIMARAPEYLGGNGHNETGTAESPPSKDSRPNLPPHTLAQTLAVFDRWLLLPDTTPVLALLGAVATNYLDGDPVWLGLVAPPSSAKTEILNALSMLPHAVQAATVTPAGLLSGTPKKQQTSGARGGLLRQIGDFGIIVLKDFGSVLSMHPETKAETLAALREVYDGAWTRHLGSDGGKTLSWQGKVGLVFAATEVIDMHHSVIGSMGDRFLLSRPTTIPGKKQFNRALDHAGATTKQMRKELAEAVAQLFAGRRSEPQKISTEEIELIGNTIALTVRLRAQVQRDRRTGEIEAIYGAEGTARIGLALERLLAGLDTLGVDRQRALAVVTSIALDSVPPLRRRAYDCVCKYRAVETADVAIELGLPTNTTRRILEELAAHGLVIRCSQGPGKADLWDPTNWQAEA
jgi:hypothetical protein